MERRVLSTDDLAASHRYVWRGPADMPLWAWRFPQWGIWIAALLLLQGSLLVTRPPFWIGVLLFTAVHPLIAWFLAGPLARRALRTETGLLYQVRTLEAEVRAPRPSPAGQAHTALPAALFTDEPQQVTTALPAHLLAPTDSQETS